MDTNNIIDIAGREAITDTLTDLLRTGAQHLITSAVDSFLGFHSSPLAA